jgi:hypothetical protein
MSQAAAWIRSTTMIGRKIRSATRVSSWASIAPARSGCEFDLSFGYLLDPEDPPQYQCR